MFNQEIFARELHKKLESFFHLELSKTQITLNLLGVNSSCSVIRENKSCHIYCIEINRSDIEYKGVEYYINFKLDDKTFTEGRTFEIENTLSSINDWLKNSSINSLYEKFSFVDQKKRLLDTLREKILEANPEISSLPENTVQKKYYYSSYSLWFKSETRSCEIYYYGYEKTPRYIFHWDDTMMFEYSTDDIKKVSNLIKKWVCDNFMPSKLKKEFSEIEFGFLAEYYENGNPIEGEFLLSWISIEEFYKDIASNKKQEIIKLIKEIRTKGFEKTLRAGQSMLTLIISRAKRNGLREDQHNISFEFPYTDKEMLVQDYKNKSKFEFDKIAYNETIDKLLKELEKEEIN